jgi:ribosomal protein L11 methyltransferase
MDDIEKHVYRYISSSPIKITFGVLRRYLVKEFDLSVTDVKEIVSKLIRSGDLCYTNHYGNVNIELSYDKPVKVSKNVVLKPSSVTYHPQHGETVVTLEKGFSFGCGAHPSTRLAIRLMDDAVSNFRWKKEKSALSALDIGTGSGVLGILAAKLGIGFVCAVDTDPCAVFESKKNAFLNSVEKL